MSVFSAENKDIRQVFIIGLVFISLNTFFQYLGIPYLPVLPVLIAVAWLMLTSLDKGILFIVFLVPFSIPLSKIVPDLGLDMYLPTEPLLAAVMLLYFVKYFKGSRIDMRILRHPVTLAIYFNIVWLFITTISSSMPVVSVKFLVARVWFIISFYILAAQIFENPKRIRQYIWSYLIPFSFVIIYVLIRHSTYGLNSQVASHFVVKPFYNDHTSYGAVLAMIIPVLLGLFVSYRKMEVSVRILFLLFIAFYFAATLFSYTRAAWVSLIGVFGIWIVIKLKIKLPILIAGAVLAVGLIFSMWTQIQVRLEQNNQASSGELTEHVQSISNVRNDDSNLERINRWNSALRMFREKPFLGWGPGTYQFNYAPFQVSHEKTSISTNTGNRGNAHSEYLGPLSESGVMGMLSIILILATSIYTGLKVYFNAKSRYVKVMSLSILLGLSTYWIHGILNNFLDTDKASALVWGYTAMLVAMEIFHMEKPVMHDEEKEALKENK